MCSKKENEKRKAEKVRKLFIASFADATDLSRMLTYNDDEFTYWTAVNSWVIWFSKNMLAIDSAVIIDLKIGGNEKSVKETIKRFASDDKLVEFIYKYKNYVNT